MGALVPQDVCAKVDVMDARLDGEENVEDSDPYADLDDDEVEQVSARELRDDDVVR